MAFASGPEPPRGGFMSGLFSVIGPEIDRQRAADDQKRDEQAQMYLDMIRSGRLSPAQADVALQNLQKLYPSKNLKTLFGKIGGVIKHFGGQGAGGAAPTLGGGQAGGSPQTVAQNAPPAPVQRQQSAPGGAGGVMPPATQEARQRFPGASNPTASRGPASNPGPPLSALPPEWSQPTGPGNVTMPHPPGVPYDDPDVELQRTQGGFRPGEALLPRPKEAVLSGATGGQQTNAPAPPPAPGPSGGGFSFGELAHTAFLPPEKLADLAAARQLKLDKDILNSREGISEDHIRFIENEANNILSGSGTPEDKQIRLEALGIKGVRATQKEVKNIPGAALEAKGIKDALGNPATSKFDYTLTESGAYYPQAPKEKKLSPDEQLASELGVPVSQVARARMAKLTRLPQGKSRGGDGTSAYNEMTPRQDESLRREAANDPSLDYDAWTYMIERKFNVRGIGKGATEGAEKIKRRAGQIMKALNISPSDLFERGGELKANMGSLSKLSQYNAMIEAFEDTLQRNVQVAKKLSDQFRRGDVRLYNRVLSAWKTGTGDPEALNLAAQLHGLAREWGKIMAGSVSALGVPISEANSVDEFFGKGLTNGQLDSLIDNVILPDARNRAAANQGQMDKLLHNIGGVTRPGGAGQQLLPPPQAPQGEISNKAQEYLKSIGR